MNWLNLQLKTLRSTEYLGADPVQRATWINLLSFCADHENGGVIGDCSDWGDRKWMQLVGVTLSEVSTVCGLWGASNDGISVKHYPLLQEQKVKRNRRNGKKGGRPSADKPDGYPCGSPDGSADGSSSLKRNSNSNRKGITKEKDCALSEPEQTENKKPQTSSTVERDKEFLALFNSKLDKKFRSVPVKASRQLTARLKEGYTVDEIIGAALACSRTEYHRSNKQHLTPEFITRDDKLQVYAQMGETKATWQHDVYNMKGEGVDADNLTYKEWKEANNVSTN